MATETQVHVRPARYGGFEATFSWNGTCYRVFFQNAYDLAAELDGECVDTQTIESVIDVYERLEWSDTDYPLFQPADAVCDYEPGTMDRELYPEPFPFWAYAAATLRIGAVTAPWVLLMISARVVWGWL